MHRTIWAVKRAHWRCWAAGRRLLRQIGVTPARLDVIQCLSIHGGKMMQTALRQALGVVRSTASEALAKLEKLGFVKRGRRTRQGRSVMLTPSGSRILDCAYDAQMIADERLERVFGNEVTWSGRLVVFERLCRRVRLAFGDPTRGVLYDWIDYDS